MAERLTVRMVGLEVDMPDASRPVVVSRHSVLQDTKKKTDRIIRNYKQFTKQS